MAGMRFLPSRRPKVLIGTLVGALLGVAVTPGVSGSGLLHSSAGPYILAFAGSVVGAVVALVIEVAQEDSRR